MDISRYGKFSFVINSEEISRGLRPSKRVPRNSGFLVECDGAVGRDNVLQTLTALARIDTTALGAITFPYPQVFVLTNVTLVCTPTKIYEYTGSALNLMATVTTGSLWRVADFYNYLYLSNGVVAVIRDMSLKYSVSSILPKAQAICNYNGQVIVGSPV